MATDTEAVFIAPLEPGDTATHGVVTRSATQIATPPWVVPFYADGVSEVTARAVTAQTQGYRFFLHQPTIIGGMGLMAVQTATDATLWLIRRGVPDDTVMAYRLIVLLILSVALEA